MVKHLADTLHPNNQDYISAELVGYCKSGVLRNPTMWLGIFVGG